MNVRAAHEVEVAVIVAATPQTVFGHLHDPARFALWMGAGATIDPRIGGVVEVPYPGGAVGVGTVVRLEPDRLVEFSWGYRGPQGGDPQPCGLVTISLHAVDEGTRVMLRHTGLPDAPSEQGHRAGWTHYVSVLGGVADAAHFAAAAANIDVLHAAWNEPDETRRRTLVERCWSETGEFQSAYAKLSGRSALLAHIANARAHVGGATLRRLGEVTTCHAFALFRWSASLPDGRSFGTGTDVVRFARDGRIDLHVGFWDPPSAAQT